MKVMGLSQWVHWIAYLIVNYAKLFVTVVVLSLLMYFVTKKSDPSVAFIFFLLYAFDTVYFSFFISSFMNSGFSDFFSQVSAFFLFLFFCFG